MLFSFVYHLKSLSYGYMLVKDVCGLDLKDAKDLVESCPKTIKEVHSREDAKKLAADLKAAGAEES